MERSFELRKLVRDKIFAHMQELGQKVTYRVLGVAEFRTRLVEKLDEEFGEYKRSSGGSGDELADMLENIEELNTLEGRSFEELRALQLKRREERGGFAGRIFVERLDLAEGDKWAEYYAGEPERFKEVTPPEGPQTP